MIRRLKLKLFKKQFTTLWFPLLFSISRSITVWQKLTKACIVTDLNDNTK